MPLNPVDRVGLSDDELRLLKRLKQQRWFKQDGEELVSAALPLRTEEPARTLMEKLSLSNVIGEFDIEKGKLFLDATSAHHLGIQAKTVGEFIDPRR